MNDIIIGIDLGTTHSEVAIIEEGNVRVLADAGQKLLPSVVAVDEQGKILVGEIAKNQALLFPERTIRSVKRLMGQDVTVELANQHYTPQEISAIILRKLKEIAELHLQQPLNKAVITVPAYFSDAQRQATREAGEIAGLDVVRIINEPTAAALSYGANLEESKKILVYDLGGGTFDVSVVSIESGVVEVLASHGNNHLGGDDFDRKIMDYLVTFIQQHHDLDIRQNRKAMARLNRAAEQAKCTLSDQPYAQIEEEFLIALPDGSPLNLSVELSRMQFEAMIEEDIEATLDAVQIALKDAKLKAATLDEILLVGGSTRIPCIQQRLLNELGIQPHSEIDPDLCVAMGAAIQAGIISGQQQQTILVDVTPYSYGTSAIGNLNGSFYPFVYVPIIQKNMALPVSKTEAFETHYDGQPFIDISIYQGEDPDAMNNIKIGEFRVEGLQDVPAGNVVTVTLSLDLNGILQVTAREKASGLEKHIRIKNALAQLDNDAIETARQRITGLFAHLENGAQFEEPPEAVPVPEIEQAEQLLGKAQNRLASVSAEDEADIQELIAKIRQCISQQDIVALDEHVSRLADILYYLES